MAINYSALQTDLENNTRYNRAVRDGKNRDLLSLLNDDESGQTVFRVVETNDLLDAIGSGVRSLSSGQLQILQIYTAKDQVDFTKASIRAEIQEIFIGQTAVQDQIQTLSSRTRSYGEGFGGTIGLRDLWKVLPNINKSYMATYIARG